jgi:two-component system, NarL family, sensor histidine kinase UhpB
MQLRRLPFFWRVFLASALVLVGATALLIAARVTITANIALIEAVILLLGLCAALFAEYLLLRRAFAPLERLARRMETVDLLEPGERLPEPAGDAIGRVVGSFNDMLDRLEAERRESGSRALAAQEGERSRIARGLHDEVGQVLTAVLLELDALAPALPAERRTELVETKAEVRQALEEVRRIARELRPEMLEELGLMSALAELSSGFSRRTGLQIERDLDASLPPLSEEAELALYRVAQESLTNIARHARARSAVMKLEAGTGSVVLTVRDDGRGFPDGRPPKRQGGIRGMRERALLVSGDLSVGGAPGGGVLVRFEVPARRS